MLFRRARKCSADEPLSDSVDVIKGGGRTSFPDGLSPSTGLGSGMGTPVLPALFPALGTGAGAGRVMRSAANCAQCRLRILFAVERACAECGVAWLGLCVAVVVLTCTGMAAGGLGMGVAMAGAGAGAGAGAVAGAGAGLMATAPSTNVTPGKTPLSPVLFRV